VPSTSLGHRLRAAEFLEYRATRHMRVQGRGGIDCVNEAVGKRHSRTHCGFNVTVYQEDGGEMKNSYLFGTLLSGLLLVGVAEAAKCRGNACDVAHVEMRDGCMVIVNDDDRPVKFYYHAGHSPPVAPHSSEIILKVEAAWRGRNQCMTSIGDHAINFAD
jgi:hypothetical protein